MTSALQKMFSGYSSENIVTLNNSKNLPWANDERWFQVQYLRNLAYDYSHVEECACALFTLLTPHTRVLFWVSSRKTVGITFKKKILHIYLFFVTPKNICILCYHSYVVSLLIRNRTYFNSARVSTPTNETIPEIAKRFKGTWKRWKKDLLKIS